MRSRALGRLACAGLLLPVLAACDRPPTEVARALTRAHNRHDTEAVARLFHDDGRIRLSDGRVLVGREGITEFVEWSRATRRRIGAPVLDGQDGESVPFHETNELNWLLGAAWMSYPPRARLTLDGRRIAELDLSDPQPDRRRRRDERLASFHGWLRDERPQTLARLHDGERWRFDSSLAALWLESAEAFRLDSDAPFRITAQPVRPRIPFGNFPTFEVTIQNDSQTELILDASSPGNIEASSVQFHFIDRFGVEHGSGTHLRQDDPTIVVPAGASRRIVVPSRVRERYRLSDRAMLPARYDARLVLFGRRGEQRLGAASSNAMQFEVIDDGSIELARRRAVEAERGIRSRLALRIEKEPGRLSLYAVNRGWSELSIGGSYWMWHFDRPDGPSSKSDGPRGSEIVTLAPGERVSLQGLSRNRDTPGRHRVWAVYYSRDLEPLARSNTVSYRVP